MPCYKQKQRDNAVGGDLWNRPEVELGATLLGIDVVALKIRQDEHLKKINIKKVEEKLWTWKTHEINEKKQNSSSVYKRKTKQNRVRNHVVKLKQQTQKV